jgi:hypothetical protein
MTSIVERDDMVQKRTNLFLTATDSMLIVKQNGQVTPAESIRNKKLFSRPVNETKIKTLKL